MLSSKGAKLIFSQADAIITDSHFVYAKKPDGWYHGYEYVNKDAIYLYPWLVARLCREIARRFVNLGPSVVVGPTVGGVILAQWTAIELRYLLSHDVFAVCADEEDIFVDSKKIGTKRVIKRGYDKVVKGKRCLIVEDIENSGATVAKTRDAILEAGGEVIGVGCLCNRSGGKVTNQRLCVPELFSLLELDMQMFKEEDFPICKKLGRGSVRTDLGKGKEFLQRIGIQPGEK